MRTVGLFPELVWLVNRLTPSGCLSNDPPALSGAASVVPKLRNGPVEQMRVLLVVRRSARLQRSQSMNQLRHLVFTAPEPIRVRFKDRPQIGLVKEAAAMRPNPTSDPVTYTTNLMIRNLARRIRALTAEVKEIDRMLRGMVEQTAPDLLDVYGVGPEGAATLLVTAGDNPERIRSERSWAHLCGVTPIPASSGKTIRHRLNRGGDRHANSALHRIVLTRMSNHTETRAYVARRRAEGLNSFEIMRCLKRYVARQVFKHLPMAA